jgi:hypothetical protein
MPSGKRERRAARGDAYSGRRVHPRLGAWGGAGAVPEASAAFALATLATLAASAVPALAGPGTSTALLNLHP